MSLSTQSIRLMTSDDLDRVLAWRNHEDVRRYMYSQHLISAKEHQNWFEKSASDPLRHLLIFQQDDISSGFVHFNLQANQRIADWGFYLAPEAKKGTGSLLGLHALNYAFHQIGLHKVCGQALNFNQQSIRFHLKMGFQQEGILKDQYVDEQQGYHSIICFGLLAAEWAEKNKLSEGS